MVLFLETSRLLLRLPTLDDVSTLCVLRSNPEVTRYIGDGGVETHSEVERFLANAVRYQERQGMGYCLVFEKSTGRFIGQAGIFHLGLCENQQEIEVAYRLLPEYWGQGYATELAKALVHWGFAHLEIEELVAATHPDNVASQRVLTKAGFSLVAKVPCWYNQQEVLKFMIGREDVFGK